MRWMKPVYVVQLLTGIAGIGAILVADHITRWHILVSAILAVSIIVSLMVVARAESDAERNRAHLDTLLRAMELPYFIIEAVSKSIRSIAKRRGWEWIRQENFEDETVYEFRSDGGRPGRLVMTAQEFKDLWILDDAARAAAIEARLFGTSESVSPEAAEGYAGVVIREAMAELVGGPQWISESVAGDGTRVYEVRRDGTERPFAALRLSRERFDELLAMLPIERYEELAREVARVVPGTP